MQENFFIKVYWIRYGLLLPDHQLAENLNLSFFHKKGQKEDKSEFVTKFIRVIATIIFM